LVSGRNQQTKAIGQREGSEAEQDAAPG
jgi:hypothetical protein